MLLLAATALLASCNDDNSSYNIAYTYGQLSEVTDNGYSILSDLGNKIVVAKSVAPTFKLEEGKRVHAQIEVFFDRDNVISANVNAIAPILTKQPVLLSKLTDAEKAEIGNDPVELYDAWFSAGKYLNIKFVTLRDRSSVAHFINLVVDEKKSTDQKVIVEFKHNAYGEPLNYKAFGIVSFDITSLVPEGADKVTIELRWNDYEGRSLSDSGIFEPALTNDRSIRNATVGTNDLIESIDR